ncbi:MAG: mechanosensitive ion channel family protein, partial [Hyphomonas sp.]|nr:mechanosensitive ion channel family protein [Hyphomonas sp.]
KDEIWVGVHALASSSVQLRLRAYVTTPEFVDVRADIIKRVKESFDAHGITIPFPHQVNVPYRGKVDTGETGAMPPDPHD